MSVHALTPILNVSDILESFAWFERFGWKKLWDWGTPPSFGAVGSGPVQIFLCLNAQGGRGKGANTSTFSSRESDTLDRGAWMSVWVDDVDAVHRVCVDAGLDITMAPADQPWGAREMHVRHPDGHVFRVSQNLPKG